MSEKEIKLDDIIMYVACWEKCVCIIGFLFKLMLFVLGKSFKASTLPGAQLMGGGRRWGRAPPPAFHTLAKDISLRPCIISSFLLLMYRVLIKYCVFFRRF